MAAPRGVTGGGPFGGAEGVAVVEEGGSEGIETEWVGRRGVETELGEELWSGFVGTTGDGLGCEGDEALRAKAGGDVIVDEAEGECSVLAGREETGVAGRAGLGRGGNKRVNRDEGPVGVDEGAVEGVFCNWGG